MHLGHRGWTGLITVLDWLADHWDQAGEGLWETRGGRQNFTYGRVMSWVAFDRALRLAEGTGRPGPVPRWRSTRDAVYEQVMAKGWSDERGAFVQHHSSDVRIDQARLVLEKMLGYANHLGLYSEEIALTGRQLGNFPQAFTHLALIDAAITLDAALNRRR
ncbi:hypothetical protein SUDANB105_04883 [Streptomyces sp. enrichment culture]